MPPDPADMAAFPITYDALIRAGRNDAAFTPNARTVVRKGSTMQGTVPPPASGGGGGGPDTDTDSAMWTALQWSDSGPRPPITSSAGLAHGWDMDLSRTGMMHWPRLYYATHCPRIDLSRATEIRLVVHNRQASRPFTNFIYPIFHPGFHWDQVPDDTSDWRFANGGTVPFLGASGDPSAWYTGDVLPRVDPRISLGHTGSYYTNWVPTPAFLRGDIFCGFAITGHAGDPIDPTYMALQARYSSSPPTLGGGIVFGIEAPGRLYTGTDQWYAKYKVDATNFGYNQAQVKELLVSTLHSPNGWQKAGNIEFQYDEGPDTKVTFRMVEESNFAEPELAACRYNADGTAEVELEWKHIVNAPPTLSASNIINHEAGHAFFSAEHTGGGIMSDFDSNRPPFPTELDIVSVRDWLGPFSPP